VSLLTHFTSRRGTYRCFDFRKSADQDGRAVQQRFPAGQFSLAGVGHFWLAATAEVVFQIRRLREAKGWSQKDFAKKVGCSQQAVSAVEQAGYKRYSLPLLRRIPAVLDADVVVALVPRRAA
jgi:DNA-binding XRE family transcriptional regulator